MHHQPVLITSEFPQKKKKTLLSSIPRVQCWWWIIYRRKRKLVHRTVGPVRGHIRIIIFQFGPTVVIDIVRTCIGFVLGFELCVQFCLDCLMFLDSFLQSLALFFVFGQLAFKLGLIALQNFNVFLFTFQFLKRDEEEITSVWAGSSPYVADM